MTHAELFAEWKATREAKETLLEAQAIISRTEAKLELKLYELEGRAHLASAAWIRAWLAGQHDECAQILASPEYRAELASIGHEPLRDEMRSTPELEDPPAPLSYAEENARNLREFVGLRPARGLEETP